MSAGKKPGYTEERIKHFFATHKLDEETRERFLALKKSFENMAHVISVNVPGCPHQTIAINKLIEAKDAACLALITETIPMEPKTDA
jgi:hypothetical protein